MQTSPLATSFHASSFYSLCAPFLSINSSKILDLNHPPEYRDFINKYLFVIPQLQPEVNSNPSSQLIDVFYSKIVAPCCDVIPTDNCVWRTDPDGRSMTWRKGVGTLNTGLARFSTACSHYVTVSRKWLTLCSPRGRADPDARLERKPKQKIPNQQRSFERENS